MIEFEEELERLRDDLGESEWLRRAVEGLSFRMGVVVESGHLWTNRPPQTVRIGQLFADITSILEHLVALRIRWPPFQFPALMTAMATVKTLEVFELHGRWPLRQQDTRAHELSCLQLAEFVAAHPRLRDVDTNWLRNPPPQASLPALQWTLRSLEIREPFFGDKELYWLLSSCARTLRSLLISRGQDTDHLTMTGTRNAVRQCAALSYLDIFFAFPRERHPTFFDKTPGAFPELRALSASYSTLDDPEVLCGFPKLTRIRLPGPTFEWLARFLLLQERGKLPTGLKRFYITSGTRQGHPTPAQLNKAFEPHDILVFAD